MLDKSGAPPVTGGGEEAVFFDLEFTAWEDSLATGWGEPGRPAEVLQVGAARVALDTREVRSTFSQWVRPKLNPEMSPYCRELLGIPQSIIDAAPPLAHVMELWYDWLNEGGSAPAYWTSWGREDLEFWRSDCERNSARCPHAEEYRDLMRESACYFRLPEICDRALVKARLGLDSTRHTHDALADALDLVGIHAAILRDRIRTRKREGLSEIR